MKGTIYGNRLRRGTQVKKSWEALLYREIIAGCPQIHTKHINILCGENAVLGNVKLVVHIVTTGL